MIALILSGLFSTMMFVGGISAGCAMLFGLMGGDRQMCAAGFFYGAGAAVLGASLMPLVGP